VHCKKAFPKTYSKNSNNQLLRCLDRQGMEENNHKLYPKWNRRSLPLAGSHNEEFGENCNRLHVYFTFKIIQEADCISTFSDLP